MSKNSLALAYAMKKRGKSKGGMIEPEKPYSEESEMDIPDSTEEFLSGQGDDEMSAEDNDFLNPPHEDETPIERVMKKRMRNMSK